jgi:hypothetical protein
MRLGSGLVLLAIGVAHLQGCGARTGFDGGDVPPGVTDADGGSPGDGVTLQQGVFCAFRVGRVPSCDVPASDGSVRRCGAPFVHCVNVGGTWGCCGAESNNNGAGGSCLFPEFGGVCE